MLQSRRNPATSESLIQKQHTASASRFRQEHHQLSCLSEPLFGSPSADETLPQQSPHLKENERQHHIQYSKTTYRHEEEMSLFASPRRASSASLSISPVSTRRVSSESIKGITRLNDALRDVTKPDKRAGTIQSSSSKSDYSKEQPEYWFPSSEIPKRLKEKGINSMREWQVDALSQVIQDGHVQKNMLIWAPTASGKSLVAQSFLWNHLLQFPRDSKISLMIVPYVALANEFVASWSALFDQYIHVSNKFRTDGFQDVSCHRLIITTPETANRLLDFEFIEKGMVHQLASILIDECHMVSRKERGPLLEGFLSKILYLSMYHSPDIRICAMSATLNETGVERLLNWMNSCYDILDGCQRGTYLFSAPVHPPVRAIAVKHKDPGISSKVKCLLLDMKTKQVSVRQNDGNYAPAHDAIIGALPSFEHCLRVEDYLKVILGNDNATPTIVFCGTRKSTGDFARFYKQFIVSSQQQVEMPHYPTDLLRKRERLKQQLEQRNVRDDLLLSLVVHGIAYHHSGLQKDIRKLIESALRSSTLSTLFATEGLSVGVNFESVARVILVGNTYSLTPESFIQSAGRCGRSDQVENPEFWLLAANKQMIDVALQSFSLANHLIPENMPSDHEKIFADASTQSLQRLFIELICSGLMSSPFQLSCFFRCVCSKDRYGTYKHSIKSIAKILKEHKFISNNGKNFVVCLDGKAVFESCQSPLQYQRRKRSLLKLKDDPLYLSDFFLIFMMISSTRLHRIPEEVVKSIRLSREETKQLRPVMHEDLFQICHTKQQKDRVKRALTVLAILNAINEQPFETIARRFGCGTGDIQDMLNNARQEAKSCLAMCEVLQEEDSFWGDLYSLLKPRVRRIVALCKPELLPLLELNAHSNSPCIDVPMARAFIQEGIRTVVDLAQMSSQQMVVVLKKHRYAHKEDLDLTVICSHLRSKVQETSELYASSSSLELSVLQSPGSTSRKRKRNDGIQSPAAGQRRRLRRRVEQPTTSIRVCRITFPCSAYKVPNSSTCCCRFYERDQLLETQHFDLQQSVDLDRFETLLRDDTLEKQWLGIQWTLKHLLEHRLVYVTGVYDPLLAFFIMQPDQRDLRTNEFKRTVDALESMDKSFLNLQQILSKVRNFYKLPSSTSIENICDKILEEWAMYISKGKMQRLFHSEERLKQQYENDTHMCIICAELEFYGLSFSSENLSKLQQSAQDEMDKAVKLIQNEYHLQTNTTLHWNISDSDGSLCARTKAALTSAIFSVHNQEGVHRKLIKDHLSTSSSPLAKQLMAYQYAQYVKNRCRCFRIPDRNANLQDYRIYSQWTILASPNLRFNSCKPNIQNIPKAKKYSQLNMRALFKARPGTCLIGADYNHIELRIAAYLAGDKELMRLLGSGDLFTELAQELNKSRDDIKRLVYSILYGRTRQTLDKKINDPEASERFWKVFERLLEYRTEQEKRLRENGYIRTALQHRSMFIDSNKSYSKQQLRAAWNYHISGTASEIVRGAMKNIHKTICRESSQSRAPVAILVVQLHDELIYEVQEGYAERFIEILDENMTYLVKQWELPVKIKRGHNWGEMTEVKREEPHFGGV